MQENCEHQKNSEMIKPEHFKLLCSFDLFEPVWNKQTALNGCFQILCSLKLKHIKNKALML